MIFLIFKSIKIKTGLNFTLVLIVILTFGGAALFVKTLLQFQIAELLIDMKHGGNQNTDEVAHQIRSIFYAVYASTYISVVANNLVLWTFAVKYWVVAMKVEMF